MIAFQYFFILAGKNGQRCFKYSAREVNLNISSHNLQLSLPLKAHTDD